MENSDAIVDIGTIIMAQSQPPIPATDMPVHQRHRENFTKEEDERLIELVQRYGTTDWITIQGEMPNRTARQCRERWRQYLSPDVVNSEWTQEDDRHLLEAYIRVGPKWTQIAQEFSKRSPNALKNRLKQLQRKASRISRSVGKNPENLLDHETFLLVQQTMQPHPQIIPLLNEEPLQQERHDVSANN